MLRIREERKKRGWSLTKVSMLTGIAYPDLSRMERGHIPAYPGWKQRLSRAFALPEKILFAKARVTEVKKSAEG